MKNLLMVFFTAGSLGLCAGNLVENGDASKDMTNWSENQVLFINGENGCFQTVSTIAEHGQLIEVDPDASYRLSVRLKAVDGRNANVLIALRLFDADKKLIRGSEVTFVANSEMIMAAPCKESDTIIKVKDASAVKLEKSFIPYVAFGAKSDLSDLPNRNLSHGMVSGIAKKGDHWEILLKKPCGFSYPAGTVIRIHRESSAYMYPVKRAELKDDLWHLVQGRTYGKAKNGGASSVYFWSGTKYVQVVIIPGRKGMVYFDDVVFEKIVK